ncbi:MAG TPA: fused MFS/spermidine synthase, partial [Planctomycetota bacterium]|nr:fused MFS/spermidine synthase [Planctomycetota bacterium]
MSRPLLVSNLFVCGLGTIATEVAAFRLLAPYFGSTQFITTNVLGVVLACLAIGYWAGGKLADRRPTATALYALTLVAGVLLAALPLAATPILKAASPALGREDASLFLGTLAAMVALFALPLLLLGMVSPFTIRLLASGDERAGRQSGFVFAVSTAGSLLGAYLPAFVGIPLLGTRRTIAAAAALVLASAIAGLLAERRRASSAVAIALLALPLSGAALGGPLKGGPGVLEERETEYHLVRVLRDERNKRTYLELNEGLSYHSVAFDDGRLPPGVWGFLQLLPPMLRGTPAAGPPMRVCIVGLAAGTVATHFQRAYGDAFDLHVDGVEIDPVVVEMGRKHFHLEEKRLRVAIEDGRTFLARHPDRYGLIVGDAYRQPYIPHHLVTAEFFALARERLVPGGICAVNAGALSVDSPVVRGIANAMLTAFPSVERFEVANFDVPFKNYVLLGADRPLRERWAAIDSPELVPFRNAALATWTALAKDPDAPTFTDDRAPVEWYTDLSLFR